MTGRRGIIGIVTVLLFGAALAACGGGTATDDTGTGVKSATIQGQVSGTVFVAVDNGTNQEVGRVTAAGTPKRFSMTIPTGKNYRFYLMENEDAGNTGRIYPVYMGAANVIALTDNAVGRTIDLGMVNPDLATGNAMPANNPVMGVPGVMAMGEDRNIPPSLSASAFGMGDMQGTWDIHSIATSGTIGWMHGVLAIDNNGMGSLSSRFRNGIPWPSMDNVPFAMLPSGIVGMVHDNAFHGVMTRDRNMMVATWTDNTGGSSLWIARRQGGAFHQEDLYGDWRFQRLTAGNDNVTSGCAFGTTTISSPGAAAISTIRAYGGGMNDNGWTLSMDNDGILTVAGDNSFHGAMSPDKNMIVATATNAQGGYDFRVMMKTVSGVSYTMSDLMGVWMLNGVVSGDPSARDWNYGQMVMDPSGQAMFSGMMGRMGAITMPQLPLMMDPSGAVTVSVTGMGGGMMNTMLDQSLTGIMNPSKDMAVISYSDGNGGYQLRMNVK
ncbi:MAG: hypothetical protein WC978_02755 [bacterium]